MRPFSALAAAVLVLAAAPVSAALPSGLPPVQPGMKVAVLGANAGQALGGLSDAVGPQGRVYVLPMGAPGDAATAAGRGNVRVSPGGSPFGLGLPEPLDLVWLTTAGSGGPSYAAAAFSGLKPGGRWVVSPAPIDPATLTTEAETAGFVADPIGHGATALRFRKP